MSQTVAAVNLAPFTVGQKGSVDLTKALAALPFNPIAVGEGQVGHIRIYNDSGSTLSITNDTGTINDYVPAGAWPTYELEPGSFTINFTIVSLLPNPPVTLLMCTIYAPGETVPDTPQLGNSPIGGQATTSNSQTLSNEGSAKTNLVIDIGDSALSQLITINNDGTATWKVDVASVAHTLITLAAAANFLKLGQAGDIVEVLGQLLVDQTLTGGGGINTNTIRDNVTGATQITLTTAGMTIANALATGEIDIGGIIKWTTAGNQKLQSTGGNAIVDATSGTDTFLNPPATGAGRTVQAATNGVARWSTTDSGFSLLNSSAFSLLSGGLSRYTGGNNLTAGSGTVVTHGLGTTPNYVSWMDVIAQPGSATVGVGSIGATTFTGTIGSGSTATWCAKF
jgi:hypothetical protein